MQTLAMPFGGRAGRSLLAGLAALVLLLVLAAAVWLIASTGYTGVLLDAQSRVIEVQPDSPGWQAGLRIGDLVADSAGTPARTWWDRLRPGAQLDLALRRGAETLRVPLEVQPLPPARWWLAIWPLLSAGAFWLAATRLLLAQREPSPDVRRFAVFAYLTALTLLAGRVRTLVPGWELPFLTLSLLSALANVWFHRSFPYPIVQPRVLALAIWHRRLGLMLLLLCLALGAVQLIDPRAALAQFSTLAVFAYDTLTALVVGVLFYTGYRHGALQRIRSRIRLIIGAVLLVNLIRLTALAAVALLPEAQLLIARISFVVQILIPLAYLIALRQEDFYVVDLVVDRAFAYVLVVIALIGLHWLGIFVLMQLLGRQINDSLLLHSVLGASLAVLFAPLRDRLARAIDRLFYGRDHDPVQTGQRIANELAHCRDEAALVRLLTLRLQRLFDAAQAVLLVRREDGGWSRFAPPGTAGLALDPLEIGSLATLMAERPVMRVAELRRQTRRVMVDPQRLPEQGVFVCFTGGERARGVLWLGPRAGGDNYTRQDIELLRLLTLPGALALENIDLHRALALRTEELQHLHYELVGVDEQVRRQLAHDLHDIVMQDIYGELYVIQARADADPAIGRVRTTLERVLAELRRLCNGLRPPALEELGLAAALRAMAAEQQTTATQFQIDLAIEEIPARMPPAIENGFFAVAKSALTNSIRHSGAERIRLALECRAGTVTLTVQDNGAGFVVPQRSQGLLKERRFGLATMRERAQMIGAALTITSAPGAGTTIQLQWHLAPTPELQAGPEPDGVLAAPTHS
ncbi:MAG: hypothetical protein OHK0022_20220 [Roseiflexaceae bacterium]